MAILFRGFVPSGGKLLVEVVVLTPDADGDSAHVFHILLFKGISSTLLLIPQSIPPTLMVFLSATFLLKACDGRALIFSFFFMF